MIEHDGLLEVFSFTRPITGMIRGTLLLDDLLYVQVNIQRAVHKKYSKILEDATHFVLIDFSQII